MHFRALVLPVCAFFADVRLSAALAALWTLLIAAQAAVANAALGTVASSRGPWTLPCGVFSAKLTVASGSGTVEVAEESELFTELMQMRANGSRLDGRAGKSDRVEKCSVLASIGRRSSVSTGERLSLNSTAVRSAFDFVISDQFSDVDWLGRRGHIHFLDSVSWRLDDRDTVHMEKEHILSVLFPPRSTWNSMLEALYAEVSALGVQVFEDDYLQATHDAAFRNALFTWILEERHGDVHPAVVRAMGHDAIPIYSGWVLFTNMFHNAVLRVPIELGGAADLLWQLQLMVSNREVAMMGNYHHMIKDILLYRYRAPLSDRLLAATCVLCQQKLRPRRIAMVGVYSAAGNAAKRAAIRETWGRVLAEMNIPVIFFLGSARDDVEYDEDDALADAEGKRFNDIVRLPVPEGYELNARKGLAFLQYVAEHYSDFSFCIKIDDDIYWRPDPALRMLEQRVPFRYVWGFLDLNSPVPREKSDPFHLSEEEWPDNIFPPYPRGAMRVISMDVVHLLANAATRRTYVIRGDDPSIGVHLRQLVMHDGEFLQLDDRGAMSRFAMEPTCRTEGTYCPLKATTWLVHHVSARTIRCMFRADLQAGYYKRDSDSSGRLSITPAADNFPSLCRCVDKVKVARALCKRGPRRARQPQCPRRPKGGQRA